MFVKYIVGLTVVQAGNCGLVPCGDVTQTCYIPEYCDMSVPELKECSLYPIGIDYVSIKYVKYGSSPSAQKNNGYCMTSNDAGLKCNNQTIGCQDGLVCNNDITGICVNLCQQDADCTDASCRVVQYCDKVTGECSDSVRSDAVMIYTLPEAGKVGICMHLGVAGDLDADPVIPSDPCDAIIGCVTGQFCDATTRACVAFNGPCESTNDCTMGTECETITECAYRDYPECTGDGPLVLYNDVELGQIGTCSVMNTEYGSPCNDTSIGCVGIECHVQDGHSDGICGERCGSGGDECGDFGVCTVPLDCSITDVSLCAAGIGGHISAPVSVTGYFPYDEGTGQPETSPHTVGFCMTSAKVGGECNKTTSSCEEGHYCRDGTCVASNGACQSKDDCIDSLECYVVASTNTTITYEPRTAADTTDGICMSFSDLGGECDLTTAACSQKNHCSDSTYGVCVRPCATQTDCDGTHSECMKIDYCPVDGVGKCVYSATESYGWYLKYSPGGPGYCMDAYSSIMHKHCDASYSSCGNGKSFVCSSETLGICVKEPVQCSGDSGCTPEVSRIPQCQTVMYCDRDTLGDCRTMNFSSYDERAVITYTKTPEGGNGLCGTSTSLECDGYSQFCGDGQVCDLTTDGIQATNHHDGVCVDLNRECDLDNPDKLCVGNYECSSVEFCGDDLTCSASEDGTEKFIKYNNSTTGTCMTRESVEGACDRESHGCEDGYICSSITGGACVKGCNAEKPCEEGNCVTVSFCDDAGNCDSEDGANKTIQYTDRSTGTVAGSCMARAMLGEACDHFGLSCDPN